MLDVVYYSKREKCAADELNMLLAAVRTIMKTNEKIKHTSKNLSPRSAVCYTRGTDDTLENMVRLLTVWMEHTNQRNVSVSLSMLKNRATSLFQDLKQCHCDKDSSTDHVTELKASSGWFHSFKICANIHNTHLPGEEASTEDNTEASLQAELKIITENSGYSPK
jgi:hypothetical protein